MDEHYVWTTTRRIKPGTRAEFEQAWQPPEFPAGMLRAYELWSEDEEEIVGISFWESQESCDRYRTSDVEEERRAAMAPYVLEEHSGTYRGRELEIPNR
jgi:heme-degrading monooxygenase HmoA